MIHNLHSSATKALPAALYDKLLRDTQEFFVAAQTAASSTLRMTRAYLAGGHDSERTRLHEIGHALLDVIENYRPKDLA